MFVVTVPVSHQLPFTPSEHPAAAPLRASPLARVTWGVLVVLILGAGLAPWSGWRDLGLSPLAFLTAPVPRHLTYFDLAINVLAFMPLGAAGVLALHPQMRGFKAVVRSGGVAVLLSATIEGLQTYLPGRISSNIDVLTNSLGAFLGAALVAPHSTAWVFHGPLARWRHQWFAVNATVPLLVVALWPLAQMAPTAMLFGQGEMREMLGSLAALFDLPWPPVPQEAFGPAEFVLAEAVVVSAGLFSAGLAATSLMHDSAPRWLLLGLLISGALLLRTVAWGVQFGAEHATLWLTPGAIGGLLLGTLALAVAAAGPPRVLGAVALLSLLVLVATTNAVPANPFFNEWIGTWRPGQLRHLAALTQWVSTAWPYVLFAALLVHLVRMRHR